MNMWKKQEQQEATVEKMLELLRGEDSFKSIVMRIENECLGEDHLVCTYLTPLNPLSVCPSVRLSVRPAKSLLGRKGPSPPQELERRPPWWA